MRRFYDFTMEEDSAIVSISHRHVFYPEFIDECSKSLGLSREIIRCRITTRGFQARVGADAMQQIKRVKKGRRGYRSWTTKDRRELVASVKALKEEGFKGDNLWLEVQKRFEPPPSISCLSKQFYRFRKEGRWGDA